MRKISLLVVLLASASAASAGPNIVLDFQGYAWEEGGFPPSSSGDKLQIACVVNDLSDALGIDLDESEVTGWISGLRSRGSEYIADDVISVDFRSGTIEFYGDSSFDHRFGTNPPNATVPTTFENGSLCLGGTLDDFVLIFDLTTGSGEFEADVVFTDGECLSTLRALRAEGFVVGGVLSSEATSSIIEGYDLRVDGFVEAEGILAPDCPFECMELVAARMGFPRRPPEDFGPTDGEFRIDGAFTPCADVGPLDPSQEEITVRIGSYMLTVGTLERDGRRKWRFENDDVETITQLRMELMEDGSWEYRVRGLGLPRELLLVDDVELEVELRIGDKSGVAQATLKQKKKRLKFRGDSRPCGSPIGKSRVAEVGARAPHVELLPASPNPFNAHTTIVLRARQAGPASVRIYDVRGRMLRELLRDELSVGEHRVVWNGVDEGGQPVASGIYVYRLEAAGVSTSRRMVLLK